MWERTIQIIGVRVLVVEGGEAPMLDSAGLDAHFAANAVKVREHMVDDDDVASAGLPIDFGSFASHGGGQAITYAIAPVDKFLEIKDENTGVVTLKATGVPFDTGEEPDNTQEFTVTADDGTRTVAYEFSVEITTNKATPSADVVDLDVDEDG